MVFAFVYTPEIRRTALDGEMLKCRGLLALDAMGLGRLGRGWGRGHADGDGARTGSAGPSGGRRRRRGSCAV